MTDEKSARREDAERLCTDELERQFAMTMIGVSGRKLIVGIATGSIGLWALMLFVSHRLHG